MQIPLDPHIEVLLLMANPCFSSLIKLKKETLREQELWCEAEKLGSFAQMGKTGWKETNSSLGSQVIIKGPSPCLEERWIWVEEGS